MSKKAGKCKKSIFFVFAYYLHLHVVEHVDDVVVAEKAGDVHGGEEGEHDLSGVPTPPP